MHRDSTRCELREVNCAARAPFTVYMTPSIINNLQLFPLVRLLFQLGRFQQPAPAPAAATAAEAEAVSARKCLSSESTSSSPSSKSTCAPPRMAHTQWQPLDFRIDFIFHSLLCSANRHYYYYYYYPRKSFQVCLIDWRLRLDSAMMCCCWCTLCVPRCERATQTRWRLYIVL